MKPLAPMTMGMVNCRMHSYVQANTHVMMQHIIACIHNKLVYNHKHSYKQISVV